MFHRFSCIVATAACVSQGLLIAAAQPPAADPKPSKPADNETFVPRRQRLPAADEPGPWDADVQVWRAPREGASKKLFTFERSGVPTLARMKDGRLIAATQHFPKDDLDGFDKVAVRFSSDDGATWTAPSVITMKGLERGMAFPFDPTLVPLPDGRVRLYFTSRRHGPGHEQDMPAIHSGISDDGAHFTLEPGVRFAVDGRIVIDCACVLHDGVFHLFVPDNGSRFPQPNDQRPRRRDGQESRRTNPPGDGQPADGPRIGRAYHAVSEDGLTFKRVDDLTIEGNRRWLGNAMSIVGDKGPEMVFIGTGDGGPPSRPRTEPRAGSGAPPNPPMPQHPPTSNVWMARSADGKSWTLIEPSPPVLGADPGAAKLPDGSWLVIITGEPREGTATARRRKPASQPSPD